MNTKLLISPAALIAALQFLPGCASWVAATAKPAAEATAVGSQITKWEDIRSAYVAALNRGVGQAGGQAIPAGYQMVAVSGPQYPVGTAFEASANQPRMACKYADGDLTALGFGQVPPVTWDHGFGANLQLPQKWAKAIGFTAGAGLTYSDKVSVGFDELQCKLVDYPTIQRRLDTGSCREDLLYGLKSARLYVLVGYVYGKEKITIGDNLDGQANVTKTQTTDKAIDITYKNDKGLTLASTTAEPVFAIFCYVDVVQDQAASQAAATADSAAVAQKAAAEQSVKNVSDLSAGPGTAAAADLQAQLNAAVLAAQNAVAASKTADAKAKSANLDLLAKTKATVGQAAAPAGAQADIAKLGAAISAPEATAPLAGGS